MKMLLLIVTAIILVLVGGVWLWAWSLPETRSGTASTEVAATPATVLAVLDDVGSQPLWRDNIASIEGDSSGWTETTRRGEKIRFAWIDRTLPDLTIRFSSDVGYDGQWTAVIEPTSLGTRIAVTETVTTPNLLTRLLAQLFFDPEALPVNTWRHSNRGWRTWNDSTTQ